jgi:hypothetical protein
MITCGTALSTPHARGPAEADAKFDELAETLRRAFRL